MTARNTALDSLRDMKDEELEAHLRERRGQLFQVRLQQTIGQVENHRQIRAIRKEIARAMTVQGEVRLARERGETPRAPRAPRTGTRRTAAAEPAAPRRRLRRAPAAAEPETPPPAVAAAGADDNEDET